MRTAPRKEEQASVLAPHCRQAYTDGERGSEAFFEYTPYGLRLSDSQLWLDGGARREAAFISHASVASVARRGRLIASALTLDLLRSRLGPVQGALPAPFHRPFVLGPLSLTLFPSGYLPGAALLCAEREGERIGYARALRTEPWPLAEPAVPFDCDALLLDATYGHPLYSFQPRAEVLHALRETVEQALSQGRVAVLAVRHPPVAVELSVELRGWGFRVHAPRTIARLAATWRRAGVPVPRVRTGRSAVAEKRDVWVVPDAAVPLIGSLVERPHLLYVGAEAVDPAFRPPPEFEGAFALADRAGYHDLQRFARRTGARKVYTVGAHALPLARALRAKRIAAQPIGPPRQLDIFPGATTAGT